MMDRRRLLGSVTTSLLIAPLAGHAQPARKPYRIGLLSVGYTAADMAGPRPRASVVDALLRGLSELGYVYGNDFVTEVRSSEGQVNRNAALIAELIALRVDVIVAPGPALAALKQATSTIPIVMAGAEDPVGLGVVKSLARPGTNFTGLGNQAVEVGVKRLEMLREIVPGPAPVAVLWDPESLLGWQAAEAAARQRGWKLLSLEVRNLAEIEAAIEAATTAKAGALLPVGGLVFRHAQRIAELAAASRLPACFARRVEPGGDGLISYGADLDAIWHRAAVFVDKILKGAKPADLAVEQPTQFRLVVSLKAAKALGIAIPQSILLRADTVIE